MKTNSSPDIKIFLIGNKTDLEDQRVISTEQGEKMKKDFGFDLFMETSAKTGFNAEELFCEASKLLYNEKDQLELKRRDSKKSLGVTSVENNMQENKKKKKCCC